MDATNIASILTMVGTETPAFIALYQAFIEAMREKDPEVLKVLVEQWNARAADQHQEAQGS